MFSFRPFNGTVRRPNLLVSAAFLCALAGSAGSVHAGSINALALNKAGGVMSDVIVYATPVDENAAANVQEYRQAHKLEQQAIAQEHAQFTPYSTVIQVGTEVKFPNYDKFEHHVKSFSAAKEFEIKPYTKITPSIVFDKTGVVIVYCLIHEWMRAYILVVDTPYFGKTDDAGMVTIDNLPVGNYEVRAWHSDMGTIKPALIQKLLITNQAKDPVRQQDKMSDRMQLKFNFDFIPKPRKASKMG